MSTTLRFGAWDGSAWFDQLKSGYRNLQREVKDDRNATHNLIHTHASVFLASHTVSSPISLVLCVTLRRLSRKSLTP